MLPGTTGFNPAPFPGGGIGTPRAPSSVTLRLISFADGEWILQWRDTGPFSPGDAGVNPNPVASWYVTTTPVAAVKPEAGQLKWAADVLAKGSVVDSVPSSGNGQLLSVRHVSGAHFEDIYVQVHGVGRTANLQGPPSQPLRLTLASNDATISDDPRSPTASIALVQNAGFNYFDFSIGYVPPPFTGNFAGVEIYLDGWMAITLIEAASLGSWDGVQRPQSFGFRLPEDSGQAQGSALFTFGSKTVTKVTGPNFAAGWAGRTLVVRTGAGAGVLVVIDTVTPTTSLDLLSNWTGATGTYSYVVYDKMTLYFVSVGPTGARRPDPGGAVSVVI